MNRILVTPTATLPGDGTRESLPEIKIDDFSRLGRMAQAGDAAIISDHITERDSVPCVKGGDYTLTGGRGLAIHKPLRVWRASDGAHFEDLDPTPVQLTVAPPHASFTRYDLVYAKLEQDKDANPTNTTRHYFADPVAPAEENAPEGDVSVADEKQNILTVLVIAGTPGPAPALPDVPSDGVALYQVTVGPGTSQLADGNIINLRHTFSSLEMVNRRLALVETDVNVIKLQDHRHDADEIDVAAPGSKLGATAQDIFDRLASTTDDDVTDLIFRPEVIRAGLIPSDPSYGKVGSTPGHDGDTGFVDIKAGSLCDFFGSPRVKIEPGIFPAVVEGTAIDARFVNKHVNQATQSRSLQTPLTLASIDSIESDGGGTLELLGYALPFKRTAFNGRAAAARDSRYIEVMGTDGELPGLSDGSWVEIDTQEGTVTQKQFTGDIPTWFIRACIPTGDGLHVLVAQQPGSSFGINGSKLEWFRVNCETGASVKFSTALGAAPKTNPDDVPFTGAISNVVLGDLISPNVVLILVNDTNPVWIYHGDTNNFENIVPTGQSPWAGLPAAKRLDSSGLCFYKPGQALYLRGQGGISSHVFDYGSRSWTPLHVAQPRALAGSWTADLWGAVLSNVNGRVQMTSETSAMWEIVPGSSAAGWVDIGLAVGFANPTGAGATFPSGRGACGFAPLLADGLPRGDAFIIGGSVNNTGKLDVWRFAAGGVIETSCGGVQGLTLGAGAKSVTFKLKDEYVLPWKVGRVYSNPIGNLPAGSVEIAYEFDPAQPRQVVKRDEVVAVLHSVVGPARKVWITLRGTQGNRPCISKLNEVFEDFAGAPGLTELVVRFNVVNAGVRYVYIKREGLITIEAAAQQTTPDKALLIKITPSVGNDPTPFDFINRRSIRIFRETTRAGGSTPAIANELPVLPYAIKAWKREPDGSIKDMPAPAVAFNTPIAITGLTVNDQACVLDMEA